MERSPNVYNLAYRGGSPAQADNTAVDEYLLESLPDWRNVQDIVRLTFKALSDVIKGQGMAIRDLDAKVENLVAIDLGQRTNRTIEDQLGDIQDRLEQSVLRKDLHPLQQSIDDCNINLESKINRSEIDQVLRSQQQLIDSMHQELGRFTTQLNAKANSDEVYKELQLKANKQSVANAFHQKANKIELEALTEKIVAQNDSMSVNNVDSILAGLQSGSDTRLANLEQEMKRVKVDYEGVYTMMKQTMNEKADKLDVDYLNQLIQRKPDISNLSKMSSSLGPRDSTSGSECMRQLEHKVAKLGSDMMEFRTTVQSLGIFRENVFEDVKNYVNGENMQLRNQLSRDIEASKLSDLNESKAQLRNSLTSSQSEMSQRLIQLSEEMRSIETRIESSLNQKISNGVIGKLEPIIHKLDKYDLLLTELERVKDNMVTQEMWEEKDREQARELAAEASAHAANLGDFKSELTRQLANIINKKDLDDLESRMQQLHYDFDF